MKLVFVKYMIMNEYIWKSVAISRKKCTVWIPIIRIKIRIQKSIFSFIFHYKVLLQNFLGFLVKSKENLLQFNSNHLWFLNFYYVRNTNNTEKKLLKWTCQFQLCVHFSHIQTLFQCPATISPFHFSKFNLSWSFHSGYCT